MTTILLAIATTSSLFVAYIIGLNMGYHLAIKMISRALLKAGEKSNDQL